jgi:hypothetical protein
VIGAVIALAIFIAASVRAIRSSEHADRTVPTSRARS